MSSKLDKNQRKISEHPSQAARQPAKSRRFATPALGDPPILQCLVHPEIVEMASNSAVVEAQRLESSRCAADEDHPAPIEMSRVSAKCGSNTGVQPSPTVSGRSACETACAPVKMTLTGQDHKPCFSTVTVPGAQTTSSLAIVVPKVATAGGVSGSEQPQVIKAPLTQVASLKPAATSSRTVMIPRAPLPPSVAPHKLQSATPRFPANIQIPAGMVLIRSDSGQLMLVSQQALAQAQQGSRASSAQAPRPVVPQVSEAAARKSKETLTVIRMAAPPNFQPGSVQKTGVVIGVAPKAPVVQPVSVADGGGLRCPETGLTEGSALKEPPATFSQEIMENVKKCKNFLVTLIKLASGGSQYTNMASNVKGLVRSLLEGKLEAEGFTEQLYYELKSTPQPCLVPFLKKSLPAVRRLTLDPQLFIQWASTSTCNLSTPSVTMKPSRPDTSHILKPGLQVIQQPRGVTVRSAVMTSAQTHSHIYKSTRPTSKHAAVTSGRLLTGFYSAKQPLAQDPLLPSKFALKTSSGSYKEDDDINDVASMAGVNLREENAQILTTTVGSVVQSCQDQAFLSPSPVLAQILHTGEALGVTDVGPEVVALVSHATQECLRGLLHKLTIMAEHRKTALKDDVCQTKLGDVRSQLRFLEEVESLKKRRKDEEEREILMHLSRSLSNTEDPQHQQLRHRAKQLQQIKESQLQQRETNLAAIAAIGPRKKRPLEHTESQVLLLPRLGVQRVTRVMLRDLLVCMEQDHFLRHSLTLYKAML
ncbi:transcription initiation factor TFIID subunit 4-like [Genypterus blacodes]|uniref:transcription initiation factor TFIID subunit 4-like n=1 Tax=Genypterus blacodes TaxID=154954 RepID=UPI003F773859